MSEISSEILSGFVLSIKKSTSFGFDKLSVPHTLPQKTNNRRNKTARERDEDKQKNLGKLNPRNVFAKNITNIWIILICALSHLSLGDAVVIFVSFELFHLSLLHDINIFFLSYQNTDKCDTAKKSSAKTSVK